MFGSTLPFGSNVASSTASLFGSGTTTTLSTGNAPTIIGAMTEQQQAATILTNTATAISTPQIFNDERDTIIAKWNQIQAFWGTGKGCYSRNGLVEFKPDNPFCRFKTVGYSCMPQSKNEDGLVSMTIAQPHDDVCKVQQQFLDALQKIIGNQQTFSVCLQGLRPLPDNNFKFILLRQDQLRGDVHTGHKITMFQSYSYKPTSEVQAKTELIIYILERPSTGPSRRVPAIDVITAFSSASMKSQLTTQLKITEVLPNFSMTPDQLKLYLDIPPAGIDPLLWQQAKLDNPAQDSLIPIPMIGFEQLNLRLKNQEKQTHLHQNRLNIIAQQFSKCQMNHTNMLSKLEEYKHKQLELGHRVLKEIVKQEVVRKLGYAIQGEEENLRSHLEAIQTELNHPTQFKGRLNELMSQIRMQHQGSGVRSDITYQIDTAMKTEIKQLLRHQQQGLQHLISVVRDDERDLQVIKQGLTGNAPPQK